jgi:hypothetical protein
MIETDQRTTKTDSGLNELGDSTKTCKFKSLISRGDPRLRKHTSEYRHIHFSYPSPSHSQVSNDEVAEVRLANVRIDTGRVG